MGILDAILGKGKDEDSLELDEYLEGEGDIVTPPAKYYIKKVDLRNEGDAEIVVKEIEQGNVVIINIEPLSKQPNKLKKIIDKLKTFSLKIDGDMAKLTDMLVITVPARVKIVKSKKPPQRS